MDGNTISILAGGWSAKSLDKSKLPGVVIGVNDSAIHAKCDIALSMDRLWTEHRWANLQALGSMRRIAYIREAALKNISARPSWLHPFHCDHTLTELSDDRRTLNGTNSGMCALNLAYQMFPKTIILFGFDMCRGPNGETYWWPSEYPWARPGGGTGNKRYSEWSAQFARAQEQCKAQGIEVLNASKHSKIDAFKKIDSREVLLCAV
jgi:hypothetical protein